jgi:hypothetical protein
MTKDAELKVLDEAIAKLGNESYLGPWLASIRAEIEMDMRSDVAPVMTVREAHATAKRIIEVGEAKAQEITARARKTAEENAKAIERQIKHYQGTMLRAMGDAVREIGRL